MKKGTRFAWEILTCFTTQRRKKTYTERYFLGCVYDVGNRKHEKSFTEENKKK